jgi:hypothetical protein
MKEALILALAFLAGCITDWMSSTRKELQNHNRIA